MSAISTSLAVSTPAGRASTRSRARTSATPESGPREGNATRVASRQRAAASRSSTPIGKASVAPPGSTDGRDADRAERAMRVAQRAPCAAHAARTRSSIMSALVQPAIGISGSWNRGAGSRHLSCVGPDRGEDELAELRPARRAAGRGRAAGACGRGRSARRAGGEPPCPWRRVAARAAWRRVVPRPRPSRRSGPPGVIGRPGGGLGWAGAPNRSAPEPCGSGAPVRARVGPYIMPPCRPCRRHRPSAGGRACPRASRPPSPRW